MIITCPACATRFVVPDSAIGVDGRVVRCAKCRHSWFEHPPETSIAPTADVAQSPFAPEPLESEPVAPTLPTSFPEHYDDLAPAREFADTRSSFAHEPPFRPRRSRAGLWLMVAILFALVIVGAVAATAKFGVPAWLPISLPHSALARAGPDLVLNFPPDQQERRPLPNGGDFFNVSGTVVNVGRERRAVPTLQIMLRNTHNDIVYSLQAASPKPVLAPGESETINQAIIDAPVSARAAEIGWKAR